MSQNGADLKPKSNSLNTQLAHSQPLVQFCNAWHTQSSAMEQAKQPEQKKGSLHMNYLTRWQRPEVNAWQGVGRLTDLRDEIDRLFESPLAELTRTSQLLSGWTPAVDLFEDKDNFVLRAELPGMKKEDIELSLHDGSLSISGERKSED